MLALSLLSNVHITKAESCVSQHYPNAVQPFYCKTGQWFILSFSICATNRVHANLIERRGWLMGSFLFSCATVFTTRHLSAHASNWKQIADFLPGAWLTNTGSQFVSAARPFSLCCPGVQLALQLNLRDMFTGKRRVIQSSRRGPRTDSKQTQGGGTVVNFDIL